jgi:DNA uptake protein ComE-like DNA-binding protein
MMGMVSRAKTPQNVRVVARSRLRAAPPDGERSSDVWLPSDLTKTPATASGDTVVAERAEAVPADPAAAAELGAEVQRLRRELAEAQKQAAGEAGRAERAERKVASLGQRIEAMKRAAAQASAVAHPDGAQASPDGGIDLNTASFEQLRALGLSVTQAARVIGQREQHGGFSAVDDVDAIVGIPRAVKQTLKQHGSV